jgi:hypothetical protein
MDTLCGILDLEYFAHGSYKRPRELGFISCVIPDARAINIQFDPGHLALPSPLDDEDKLFQYYNQAAARHTFWYQKTKVHGLSFRPHRGITSIPHDCLPQIVSFLYESHKTSSKYRLGFKGGSFERDILHCLNIPYLNLEDITGCPRVSLTVKDSCGHHIHCPTGYLHCASAEVTFYHTWLFSSITDDEN